MIKDEYGRCQYHGSNTYHGIFNFSEKYKLKVNRKFSKQKRHSN